MSDISQVAMQSTIINISHIATATVKRETYPVANALNELPSTLIFPFPPFDTEYTSFSPRDVALTILSSNFSACCGNRRCRSDSIPVVDGSESTQRAVGAATTALAIASRPDMRLRICIVADDTSRPYLISQIPSDVRQGRQRKEANEEGKKSIYPPRSLKELLIPTRDNHHKRRDCQRDMAPQLNETCQRGIELIYVRCSRLDPIQSGSL